MMRSLTMDHNQATKYQLMAVMSLSQRRCLWRRDASEIVGKRLRLGEQVLEEGYEAVVLVREGVEVEAYRPWSTTIFSKIRLSK